MRRARRSFWVLVVVSVLATGVLSSAVAAPASPATGVRVAISGLVLIVSVALAARVLHAVDRAAEMARDRDRNRRAGQQSAPGEVAAARSDRPSGQA